jgi:hypothetical protein
LREEDLEKEKKEGEAWKKLSLALVGGIFLLEEDNKQIQDARK